MAEIVKFPTPPQAPRPPKARKPATRRGIPPALQGILWERERRVLEARAMVKLLADKLRDLSDESSGQNSPFLSLYLAADSIARVLKPVSCLTSAPDLYRQADELQKDTVLEL
jgi:hypothetical protein